MLEIRAAGSYSKHFISTRDEIYTELEGLYWPRLQTTLLFYVSHVTVPRVDVFQTQMCCCQANHSTDIELYEGSHYISSRSIPYTLPYFYSYTANVENMVSS